MDVQVSVETTGEVSRDITFEIPRAMYDEQYQRALSQASARAKMKGFRPGKVPRALIDKTHGAAIHYDVLTSIVDGAFRNAVVEHNLKVVGKPEVDVGDAEAGKDFTVKASVSVMPEPEIKDYFGVSFDVEVQEFCNTDYEKRVQQFAENFATTEDVEDRTTVENGDVVAASYCGTIDGKEFEGSSSDEGMFDVGSGYAPKEFEDGLIGATIGEEKVIEVTMPDDIADKEIAGKRAAYAVVVKSIQKKIVPELTDELVKEKRAGESVEELRENIRKNFEQEIERANKAAREDALFKALIAINEFEVPQVMIDEEIREILIEARLLDPSKEESYKISVEQFRDRLGEGAAYRVKRAIVLERIMTQEKTEATDEEVDAWLQQQAEQSHTTRDVIEKMYQYPQQAGRIKNIVARSKTLDLLFEKAKVKETVAKHHHD